GEEPRGDDPGRAEDQRNGGHERDLRGLRDPGDARGRGGADRWLRARRGGSGRTEPAAGGRGGPGRPGSRGNRVACDGRTYRDRRARRTASDAGSPSYPEP